MLQQAGGTEDEPEFHRFFLSEKRDKPPEDKEENGKQGDAEKGSSKLPRWMRNLIRSMEKDKKQKERPSE